MKLLNKKIVKCNGMKKKGTVGKSKAINCKEKDIGHNSMLISIVGTVIAGVILKFDFWEIIVDWIEKLPLLVN